MTQKNVKVVITDDFEIIPCVHSDKELKQMLDYPKLYSVIAPHGLLTQKEFDESL